MKKEKKKKNTDKSATHRRLNLIRFNYKKVNCALSRRKDRWCEELVWRIIRAVSDDS